MAENTNTARVPLSIQLSILVVGLLAFFFILYIGRVIIVPLVFATLLAILLNPVVNKLCDWGVNRIIGIVISVLCTIAVVGLLIAFISWQATMFSDTFRNSVNALMNYIITA